MGGRNIRPFLSVYGHVSIDQILSVNEFPRSNTSVDVLAKTTHLGGIATNISVIASAFGVPTAICAFVGHDFPPTFEKFIEQHGTIMDELVKVDQDTSTAVIVNDRNMDQKVCFFQGPQGCASKQDIDLINNSMNSKIVHFSTGDPEYYIKLMGRLRSKDRKISFDPAQEIRDRWQDGRFQKGLERSDILFCNEFEAEAVKAYMKIDSLSEIKKELVICTKGNKGSEVFIEGRRIEIPAIEPKRIVDPTGAGDAYRAGFYSGLFRNHSIERSLVLASAASSFIVEDVGALTNIPTWDDVMERADKELTRF